MCPKILTAWNKLTLPRITLLVKYVIFQKSQKRFPNSTVSPHWMVTPLIIWAHLGHRFLYLVKASERQWGTGHFAGAVGKLVWGNPKNMGWLQKSCYTYVHLIWYLYHQNMIIHSSMRIYGESILFMMLRGNMYLIVCYLEEMFRRWWWRIRSTTRVVGRLQKDFQHTIAIPCACVAGSRKPAGFRRNWPQARKQSSSSKRWSWKESDCCCQCRKKSGTTCSLESMQQTIWAIKY